MVVVVEGGDRLHHHRPLTDPHKVVVVAVE